MATNFPEKREKALKALQGMLQACMQCGTCSASCPSSVDMDYTPRQVWRLVLLGQLQEIWHSHTFWLCSNCYTCTLRCPRGLPLTEAMNVLKRLAPKHTLPERREAAFYQSFMDSVRKHGRVQEMDMMMHYFRTMRDPTLPLRFAPLGSKLLWHGKMHHKKRWAKGEKKLEQIFAKVQEMEGESCAMHTTQDAH
ncbi:MAG: 4Fe-4S dicluster domain-containing protein [Desulfohalobiaceae bacterium]